MEQSDWAFKEEQDSGRVYFLQKSKESEAHAENLLPADFSLDFAFKHLINS